MLSPLMSVQSQESVVSWLILGKIYKLFFGTNNTVLFKGVKLHKVGAHKLGFRFT